MSHKRERHPVRGGAAQQEQANDTGKAVIQHGPVALGLGYRATFTLAPAVGGVASLIVEFAPAVPETSAIRRVYARYGKERDKFLKLALPRADCPVIRVEVRG